MGGATAQHSSQEGGFQQWKSKYAPNDSGADYDLKGAYYAGARPDMERGHFPDTFKLPNHPTFSTGSKYSTPEQMGGEWGQTPQGKDTYEPSRWMERDPARMAELAKYMKQAEPNAVLVRRAEPVGTKLLPETNIPSVNAYFKQHPEVAAMVTGAGANGMPEDMPAGVQFNPYNANMAIPKNRQSVWANESIRNKMNQTGYSPS